MKFGPERYAMHALNGILAGMAAGSASGGGWDLDVPQHAMEPAVDHLVRQATAAGKHARMLRGLLSVELPEITRHISPHDLVAIRRNEEIFADWRHELRAALRALTDETDSEAIPPTRQLLQQELEGAARRANAGVGRSAAITAVKSGLIGTSISTIVGLAFGSLAISAAGAGLSTTAGLLFAWLRGMPQRPVRRALAPALRNLQQSVGEPAQIGDREHRTSHMARLKPRST